LVTKGYEVSKWDTRVSEFVYIIIISVAMHLWSQLSLRPATRTLAAKMPNVERTQNIRTDECVEIFSLYISLLLTLLLGANSPNLIDGWVS
jgi:hypothetical protein